MTRHHYVMTSKQWYYDVITSVAVYMICIHVASGLSLVPNSKLNFKDYMYTLD